MKILPYNYPRDPYIPTEETMFNNLEKIDTISDEYILCELPLTHMINTMGVGGTQNEINKTMNDVSQKYGSAIKKIFICQHILVSNLRFDNNSIVCTPHASLDDDFISIPHFPVNVNESFKREKREMLFSFLGSTTTHEIRRGLSIIYPNNCFSSNHHWGLDHVLQANMDFRERYQKMLGNSIFSICPRGTGISSVRLFESIAMNAIPVIVANGYKPPLHEIINWKEIAVFVPENKIRDIGKMLSEGFSDDRIKGMQNKLQEVYEMYLSPENFHKSIELLL